MTTWESSMSFLTEFPYFVDYWLTFRNLQLQAQDQALDDTIYELDRFLQRGVISIDVYTKVVIWMIRLPLRSLLQHVRALAHEQFLIRATRKKIALMDCRSANYDFTLL